MKTLLFFVGVAATLTVLYAPRKFIRFTDRPATPEGWEPKMMAWKNGVRVK